MKKILVFNGFYIPAKNAGGPTTSMATIVEHCSEDFEFYIVAANHDLNETTIFSNIHSGWNDVGKAKVLYLDLKKLAYGKKHLALIFEDVKPDLVWLVGILVPASKWNVANLCRRMNIPYLISPRGEVCDNAFHIKFAKKRLVASLACVLNVYKNAYYHATSDEEILGLIKYYNADKNRVFLVPNIAANLNAKCRSIAKKPGELKVAFISRIQSKKNILTAIKAINKLTGSVSFDIYGPMESREYWDICENEIKRSPKNVEIRYCGALEPEEVSKTFEKYHCFLFPTESENYGHVIVESLSVSCPVILSKNTTPWDDLSEKAGYICELNDIEAFYNSLNEMLCMDQKTYNGLMADTLKYFDKKMKENDAVEGHINMFTKCCK